MIPDLGKYADTVLSAYAITIALLLAFLVATLWRGRKVRAELEETEKRTSRHG